MDKYSLISLIDRISFYGSLFSFVLMLLFGDLVVKILFVVCVVIQIFLSISGLKKEVRDKEKEKVNVTDDEVNWDVQIY